jgi:hypothetical protein
VVPAGPPLPPVSQTQSAANWNQPAPITQLRRKSLSNLKELYRQQRIQGVRIVTAPNCCSVCHEVAASIYDPSIAPPIPIAGCADGWNCRCMYGEEPLPLDERGRRAMQRIEAMEHERELRRAGVPVGGPRWLHLSVMAVAIAIAVSSLHFAFTAADAPVLAAEAVLAAFAGTVAIQAMWRLRPIPNPAWVYIACGAGVALLALAPIDALISMALAASRTGHPFDQLSIEGILSGSLAQLTAVQIFPLAGGLALMLLGLLALSSSGKKHR